MTRKPLALALALAWVSAADDQVHAPMRNRRKAMEADTVQALRDAKALFDEGILSEQEFKEQKAELLQPKATVAAAPCGFRAFFERNAAGPGIHKWLHYFSAYEQEFSRHCGAGGAPAKMIEIGIQSGGSMRMWRERFGQNLEVLVRKGSTVLDALYDNKEGACCKITPNSVQHEIEYVKMYPMILAIKKRETPLDAGVLQAQKRGDKWIPY